MKYLLLLIGLVMLQFTTSYCCWECKDDDNIIITNPMTTDPMVDEILKYTDDSYWVYKEQTGGETDTVKVLNYTEDTRVEYGVESNMEYRKKTVTLSSSLNHTEYDIAILRPIPDNYNYLNPILFKGKAGTSGQDDAVEDIIYFYAPQANIKEQTIEPDQETPGVVTNKYLAKVTVNGKEYSDVTRITHTRYPGTTEQSINTYFYSAGYGLIKYIKNNGETWELITQSLTKRHGV